LRSPSKPGNLYSIEALKLQTLQARAAQAKAAIEEGNTADGEAFFDALESVLYCSKRQLNHSVVKFENIRDFQFGKILEI